MSDLTIAIPVFNTNEQQLEQLTNCLHNQTFKHFDVLLYDDCSTNKGTLRYLNRLETLDNYRVVHGESNKGVYHARNMLINLCSTKFISFIDSDDLIPNDYLEKLYEPLDNDENSMTFCRYIKASSTMAKTKIPTIKPMTYESNLLDMALCGKFGHSICGKMFETNLLRNYIINEKNGFDDAQCIPVLAQKVKKIILVDTCYIYIYNQKSIMHSSQKPLYQAYLTFMNYLNYQSSVETKMFLDAMLKLAYIKLNAINYSPIFNKKTTKEYISYFRKNLFKLNLDKKSFLVIFCIITNYNLFKNLFNKHRNNL